MKRMSFVKVALALVLGVAAAVHADPTLITITQHLAGGHGSSNSNGNFEAWSETNIPLTITANTGYVIAQIATNGVPVADAFGQTTCSFDAVFLANATLTATFAKEKAWWVAPGVFKKVNRADGFFDGSENLSQFGISESKVSTKIGRLKQRIRDAF